MAEQTNRPTIPLTLTPEQRERIRQATGQDLAAIELAREVVLQAAGTPRFRITPDGEFFQRVGIYQARGFLDPELCARLCSEVRAAAGVPGLTYVRQGSEPLGRVDESVRRTLIAQVSAATASLVEARLEALRPALERYFGLETTRCQTPQFLRYRQGDFCQPHGDHLPDRRVVTILFLNGEGPGPDSYAGGSLTLYGLSGDPDFERCGFPVVGETGLLVAFRSDVMHAVTPVIRGERYTVASALTASSEPPAARQGAP